MNRTPTGRFAEYFENFVERYGYYNATRRCPHTNRITSSARKDPRKTDVGLRQMHRGSWTVVRSEAERDARLVPNTRLFTKPCYSKCILHTLEVPVAITAANGRMARL